MEIICQNLKKNLNMEAYIFSWSHSLGFESGLELLHSLEPDELVFYCILNNDFSLLLCSMFGYSSFVFFVVICLYKIYRVLPPTPLSAVYF